MSVSATQSLYSREILRLATSLPHQDCIEQPYLSATRRAPVCGSEMSVDVALEGDKLASIAIRAKACALGQASASILRVLAPGKTIADISALAAHVAQALRGEGEMPSDYATLAYARDYPARHGAILLPFDTLLAALESGKA
jgi:NifU-like protein involved in Fe-S cluster formation